MSRTAQTALVAAVLCALALMVLLWFQPGARPLVGGGAAEERRPPPLSSAPPAARIAKTAVPARTAHLVVDGVVIDEQGSVVPRAAVLLTGHAEVRTGSDGRFQIGDVVPGSYYLNAHSDSAAAGPVPLRVDDEAVHLTVRLHAGVTLTVDVVSAADGHPVVGVRGTLIISNTLGEAGTVAGVADGPGILRFPVTAFGNYHVAAEADGFAPATRLLTWSDRSGLFWRIQIALEPGVVLSGRVVDEDDAPVAGAKVSSRPPPREQTQVAYRPRPPDPLRSSVETDADGRFRYPVPLGQGLVLVVQHERYTTSETAPMIATHAAEITVTLKAGRSLSGRVVDRNQRPVEAAITDGSPQSRPAHIARSDAQGRFVLEGIDPRRKQVVVFASTSTGRATPILVSLPDGFARQLKLVIDNELRIAGRVIEADGTPVADAIVGFSRALTSATSSDDDPVALLQAISGEVRADGEGAFVVAGLAAGEYRIFARAPMAGRQRVAAPRMAHAIVNAGDEKATITMPVAARIRGRVIGGDRRPARSFVVTLGQFGGPNTVESTDGRFELLDLDPTPEHYQVRVCAEGSASQQVEAQVVAGQTTDLGTIVLDPGRTLRGRVFETNDGGPVGNALVSIDGPEGTRVASGRTDDLGAFEIAVPIDPVMVHATVPGVGSSRFELVSAEQTKVDLRLPETGRIELVVTGAESNLGNLSAIATRTDTRDGGFRIWLLQRDSGPGALFHADVSPGEYVIHAVSGQGLAALKKGNAGGDVAVTVQVGQTQRARIALGNSSGFGSP